MLASKSTSDHATTQVCSIIVFPTKKIRRSSFFRIEQARYIRQILAPYVLDCRTFMIRNIISKTVVNLSMSFRVLYHHQHSFGVAAAGKTKCKLVFSRLLLLGSVESPVHQYIMHLTINTWSISMEVKIRLTRGISSTTCKVARFIKPILSSWELREIRKGTASLRYLDHEVRT